MNNANAIHTPPYVIHLIHSPMDAADCGRGHYAEVWHERDGQDTHQTELFVSEREAEVAARTWVQQRLGSNAVRTVLTEETDG